MTESEKDGQELSQANYITATGRVVGSTAKNDRVFNKQTDNDWSAHCDVTRSRANGYRESICDQQ